jgi:hypothetical protein
MEIFYILAFVAAIYLLIGVLFGPRASLFWYRGSRTKGKSNAIYRIAFASLGLAAFLTAPSKTGGIPYEVLDSDAYGAVVFLEQKDVATDQLTAVADSLYRGSDSQLHKYGTNYKVMFYYRRDYKDQMCYAYKAWLYDESKGAYSEYWVTN